MCLQANPRLLKPSLLGHLLKTPPTGRATLCKSGVSREWSFYQSQPLALIVRKRTTPVTMAPKCYLQASNSCLSRILKTDSHLEDWELMDKSAYLSQVFSNEIFGLCPGSSNWFYFSQSFGEVHITVINLECSTIKDNVGVDIKNHAQYKQVLIRRWEEKSAMAWLKIPKVWNKTQCFIMWLTSKRSSIFC